MGAIHRRRQDVGPRSPRLPAKRKLARLPSIAKSSEKVIDPIAAGSARTAWRTSPAISEDWILYPSSLESAPSQECPQSIECYSDCLERAGKVVTDVGADDVQSRDVGESREFDSDTRPPQPQRLPTPDLPEIDGEEYFGCCGAACDVTVKDHAIGHGMLIRACCSLSGTHHCVSSPSFDKSQPC